MEEVAARVESENEATVRGVVDLVTEFHEATEGKSISAWDKQIIRRYLHDDPTLSRFESDRGECLLLDSGIAALGQLARTIAMVDD